MSPRPHALITRCLADNVDGTVVITVIAVGMMQVTVDQVVDVIAVRYRLMTASGAVHMVRGMGAACVSGCTRVRIHVADFHNMFLDFAVLANMMQMPVVQVVDVITVLDSGVFAVRAMRVIVVFVDVGH